jgi:hypothetical protein
MARLKFNAAAAQLARGHVNVSRALENPVLRALTKR